MENKVDVLILCAGKGTRMKQQNLKNKCLIKVNNKSLIHKKIEDLSKCSNINRIIVVVGHEKSAVIKEISLLSLNKKVIFITQNEQLGIVNAIKISLEKIKCQNFMLCLGDEYLEDAKYCSFIDFHFKKKSYITIGHSIASSIHKKCNSYSIIIRNNRIKKLIEKPKILVNNYIGTGVIIFSKSSFNCLLELQKNYIRNEIDLVDVINYNIDKCINMYLITEKYFNINKYEDIDKVL